MTRDALLEEVQSIGVELDRLLTGMEYCLDWKPQEDEWSAREVVYHMVDTPAGGIHAAVQSILDGSARGLTVTASLTNLSDARMGEDLDGVKEDIDAVLMGLEGTLSAVTDDQLSTREAPVRSTTRGVTENRSAQDLTHRLFVNHWREHLLQLEALRDALGIT